MPITLIKLNSNSWSIIWSFKNWKKQKDKNINNKSNGQYLGTDDDYGNNKGKPTLL